MTTALALRAPADLSKEEIWKKCVSLAKTRAREKAEEVALFEKVLAAATIGGTAIIAGWIFTKFPAIETIGPVPVQPTLGVLALLYGMFTKGMVAQRASDVGIGLLGPWLFEKGAEFAMP